ncbi:unnamed protein product [Prorocentrum cordatum]|uniref:PRA1 family protein n=1 Tax=Prorocentrum cordatum TaxID=2364126 RepID=A0ABN9W5T3_9DINO|nr:unnamed protein product [Polarella glacialis]
MRGVSTSFAWKKFCYKCGRTRPEDSPSVLEPAQLAVFVRISPGDFEVSQAAFSSLQDTEEVASVKTTAVSAAACAARGSVRARAPGGDVDAIEVVPDDPALALFMQPESSDPSLASSLLSLTVPRDGVLQPADGGDSDDDSTGADDEAGAREYPEQQPLQQPGLSVEAAARGASGSGPAASSPCAPGASPASLDPGGGNGGSRLVEGGAAGAESGPAAARVFSSFLQRRATDDGRGAFFSKKGLARKQCENVIGGLGDAAVEKLDIHPFDMPDSGSQVRLSLQRPMPGFPGLPGPSGFAAFQLKPTGAARSRAEMSPCTLAPPGFPEILPLARRQRMAQSLLADFGHEPIGTRRFQFADAARRLFRFRRLPDAAEVAAWAATVRQASDCDSSAVEVVKEGAEAPHAGAVPGGGRAARGTQACHEAVVDGLRALVAVGPLVVQAHFARLRPWAEFARLDPPESEQEARARAPRNLQRYQSNYVTLLLASFFLALLRDVARLAVVCLIVLVWIQSQRSGHCRLCRTPRIGEVTATRRCRLLALASLSLGALAACCGSAVLVAVGAWALLTMAHAALHPGGSGREGGREEREEGEDEAAQALVGGGGEEEGAAASAAAPRGREAERSP